MPDRYEEALNRIAGKFRKTAEEAAAAVRELFFDEEGGEVT